MRCTISILCCLIYFQIAAQINPLWTQQKVKNYLPHMTVPEVEAFLKKSDIVIIPVGALEQHGNHLPIGTDFINGVERCKLIAQERNILVVPVLMAGQSPYHMGFAGTITLSADRLTVDVNLNLIAFVDSVRIVTVPEPSVGLLLVVSVLVAAFRRHP